MKNKTFSDPSCPKGCERAPFPSVFKEGWLRLNKKSHSSAAQTGWLVGGRVASLYAREVHLILLEITNHPVCAAKERDLFINGAATPP